MSEFTNLVIGDEFEFSTTVHLNELSNVRKQLIYGSESYGTSYSVYANFQIVDSIKEGYIKIGKVSYTIINYKGILNMGFFERPVLKYDETNNSITIDLKIIGNSNNHYEKPIDEKQDVKIVTKGCVIIVDRELLPLNGQDSNIQYHGAIFDEEFHYRDGHFLQKKTRYDDLPQDNSDPLNNETVESFRPGKRCRVGKSIVVF